MQEYNGEVKQLRLSYGSCRPGSGSLDFLDPSTEFLNCFQCLILGLDSDVYIRNVTQGGLDLSSLLMQHPKPLDAGTHGRYTLSKPIHRSIVLHSPLPATQRRLIKI